MDLKSVTGPHGVASIEELERAAISRTMVRDRVRAGVWQRLFAGVVFLGAGPIPKEAWWMGGVKAAGPGAVLSHESAASLWAVVKPLLRPVHVTIPYPANRKSRPGLKVHRSRAIEATVRNGIAVTTLQRTLQDLPQPLRDRAVNTARVNRLLPNDGTMWRSRAERDLGALMRRAGIGGWRRNQAVEGFECDFVFARERVIVECDGPHHRFEPQLSIDRARDARLALAGWIVVRVDAGDPDLDLIRRTVTARR